MLVEARRFVIVGIINTVVDLVVLNALILLTHTGRSGLAYTGLKTASFLVAMINSYFMNRNWTFGTRAADKTLIREWTQFFVVSAVGAVVNVGCASYFATFVGPPPGLHPYWPSIAALFGTACGFSWNFVGYKWIVFSERKSAAEITELGIARPVSPLLPDPLSSATLGFPTISDDR